MSSAHRTRMKRLLSGDFQQHDLFALLLAVRSKSFGERVVQEVGDLVAHAEERDRGITTEAFRNWLIVISFKLENIYKRLDERNLPPQFEDFLTSSLNLMDEHLLKVDTGLSKRTASSNLKYLLSKISTDSLGRKYIAGLSDVESKLLDCLCNYIVSNPAFDDQEIEESFRSVFLKNNLLVQSEILRFKPVAKLIALLVISLMHDCKIVLKDGGKSRLLAGVSKATGHLIVYSLIRVASPVSPLNFASVFQGIFMTELPAQEYASHEMISALTQNSTWERPIELTADGKLAFLTTL